MAHEISGERRKKRRKLLTAEEKLRASQLEEALFGGSDAFLSKLGEEEQLHEEELEAAAAASRVWEDRAGCEVPDLSDDSEPEAEQLPAYSDSDSDSQPLEESSRRSRPAAAPADSGDEEAASPAASGAALEAEGGLEGGESLWGDGSGEGEGEEEEPASVAEREGDILLHTRNAQKARAEAGEGSGVEEWAGTAQGDHLQPAWQDEDDEELKVDIMAKARTRKLRSKPGEGVLSGVVYEERLRAQHAKLHPRTDWAALAKAREEGEEEEGEEGEGYDELLASATPLLGRSERLPPGALETSRLRDANQVEPCKAVVQSLEFHPAGHLLLTASLDKHLRFFKVDGVRNERVQSIFFSDLPITKAAFVGGGSQVVATGRRRYFYVYDLGAAKLQRVPGLVGRTEKSLESFVASPTEGSPLLAVLGNEGCVPLVSAKLRQCVGELQMAGTVRAAAFTPDGTHLLTAGGDGVVYTWDVRMQRCLSRHVDEGSLGVTALAAGGLSGDLHATGSRSGVVNLYRRSSGAEAGVQKPLKSFLNLTTTIDTLAFSPDSQMLVVASRMKKDALRVVHVASRSVFANWPTSRSPLGHVHSAAFSPSGAFLAVGNAKGRAVLYRMHHYPGGLPEEVEED